MSDSGGVQRGKGANKLVGLLVLAALVACCGCGEAAPLASPARGPSHSASIVRRGLGPSGHEDEDGDYDFFGNHGGDYVKAAAERDERAVQAVASGLTTHAAIAAPIETRLDGDRDNDNYKAVLGLGRAAGPADRHAVSVVVRRYLAAGAAGDTRAGCALLAPGVAAAAVARYSRARYLHGGNCGELEAALFRARRREFEVARKTLYEITVRVEGDRAVALLAFSRSSRGLQLALARRDGEWKLDGLLPGELPYDGEAQ